MLLTLLGLMALMASLTAPRVFTAPLWGDELRTWRDGIEKPLGDVVRWQHNADHAPLGHLLARGGAAAFGVERPWSLRLGAWLCGLACVPAIWRLGRTIESDTAGLLMAAFLVIDPNVVFQATQARMYPLLLLASIVALTAATRLVTARATWRTAAVLAVALAIGLWMHSQIYAVLVATLVTGIVLTILPGGRAAGRRMLAGVLGGLVIGAPGVLKLLGRRNADPLDEEEAARPFAQLEDATRALTGENWITALLVLCAIAGLVTIARRRGRAAAWLLAGVIVMSVLNLLIAARYRPVAFPRYLTVMQPPLWAAVAVCCLELIDTARRRLSRPRATTVTSIVAATLIGLGSYTLWRTIDSLPAHPVAAPFRDAVRAAAQEARTDPSHRIVVLPRSPYATFARYYGVISDEATFNVIAPRVPRERGRRPAPTTAEAAAFSDTTAVTIVGVIPARGSKARSAEDPIAFARALANAREIKLPDIPTPDGTLRVIIVRFDGQGGVQITDAAAK